MQTFSVASQMRSAVADLWIKAGIGEGTSGKLTEQEVFRTPFHLLELALKKKGGK